MVFVFVFDQQLADANAYNGIGQTRHTLQSQQRLQTKAKRGKFQMNRSMSSGTGSVSHCHLRSLLADMTEPTGLPATDHIEGLPSFKIRAADSSGERSSANILIDKMYATRGYQTTPLPAESTPNLITLVASDHHSTIGTLTIGFDSGDGLLVDDLFPDEVNKLRDSGRTVCEFTKLAMDNVTRSKPVLAALFNVAYLYAHKIKFADNLLIEVNPRHVRYYRSMLGFTVIGPKRLNRRVNAPAVLLSLDLAYAREQISNLGGKPELAETCRSLYPFSFSGREEAGIIGRLRRTKAEAIQVFGFYSDRAFFAPTSVRAEFPEVPMFAAQAQAMRAHAAVRATV